MIICRLVVVFEVSSVASFVYDLVLKLSKYNILYKQYVCIYQRRGNSLLQILMFFSLLVEF